MADTWLHGRAGWLAWLGDGSGDHPPVLVRLRQDDTQRLVISELYLRDDAVPLTSSRLRSVPLGRIEAACTSGWLRRAVLESLDDVDEEALDELLSGVEQFLAALPLEEPGQVEVQEPETPERPLRRPGEGDSYSYYEEVAVQYRLRAARSRRPAALLAEEAGVPVGTVHRWIRDARRLGFLPSGVKGKAG